MMCTVEGIAFVIVAVERAELFAFVIREIITCKGSKSIG